MRTTPLLSVLLIALAAESTSLAAPTISDPAVAKLAKEVAGKGWIMYCNPTAQGDFDIFLMRPDGSQQRNITNDPKYHQGAARFSPDGKKIMYRRYPRNKRIDKNRWGAQGHLVIADADGSDPVVLGRESQYPWASWSPDGKQLARLTRRGIQIVDMATEKVVRTLPRKGIYQQLFWSPDGKWLCGVTNTFGEYWTVGRMDAETGEINAVRKFKQGAPGLEGRRGAACTPDWFPDSKRIIFSHLPADRSEHPWTQLWMADADGKNIRLLYGDQGRHIYGGTTSPDGKYILFNGVRDETQAGALATGTPMGIIRFEDAPVISGESTYLRNTHPGAKDGPVLTLPVGFEPDWTFTEIPMPGK